MFNWLSFKKFIFVVSVGAGILTPAFVLNSKTSNFWKSSTSDIKKAFLNSGGDSFFSGTQYFDLLSELLDSSKGKSIFRKTFVSYISMLWWQSQGFQKNQQTILDMEKKEMDAFNKLVMEDESQKTQVFDSNGGTRDVMKKRFLSSKSHEKFKNLLIGLAGENFTLNKTWQGGDYDDSFFVSEHNYINKSDLENSNNWDKIGFFPTQKQDTKNITEEEKKYLFGRFDFLNWSYKQWYAKTLPYYTWMSLWKHADSGLEQKYELSKITDSQLKSKPNYFLPVFKGDKFKDFVKSLGPKDNSTSADPYDVNIPFVPRGYTDDSSTSILVNASTAHSSLYTEFASASNYKFAKLIKEDTSNIHDCLNGNKKDHVIAASDAQQSTLSEKINEIDDVYNLTDPLDIFLSPPNSSATQPDPLKVDGGILIDKDIIKNAVQPQPPVAPPGQSQTDYTLYEARELKGKDWMFLRNQAGVHAIMVDGAHYIKTNGDCKIKRAFEHFNFRNLQNIHKKHLNLSNTIDAEALTHFTSHLSDHFDELIIKYLFESKNAQSYLFHNINNLSIKYLEKFKSLLLLWDELEFHKNKQMNIYDTRRKIIDHYGTRSWEAGATDKKITAPKTAGLSGTYPYKFESDATKPLFPDQELLLNKITHSSAKTDDYENIAKKIKDAFYNLSSDIKLSIDSTRPDFLASERIFLNDFIFSTTFDQLLDDSVLFNDAVKSVMLNKKMGSYLSNTFFNQKTLDNKDFLFVKSDAYELPQQQQQTTFFNNFLNPEIMQKFLKQFFYSQFHYSQQKNWFDPLVYSRYASSVKPPASSADDEFENIKKFLIDNAEHAFKQSLYFSHSDLKTKYTEHLITLNYLIKDDFKNFRDYVKGKISNFEDAYFVFKKHTNSLKETQTTHLFTSPYLNNYPSSATTKTYQTTKIEELNRLIPFLNTLTTNQTKVTETGIATGTGTGTGTSTDQYEWSGISSFGENTNLNPLNLSDSIKNPNNLFAYHDLEGFIAYIEGADETKFNHLINSLRKKMSSSTTAANPTIDQVIVSSVTLTPPAAGTSPTALTFQHKKNALISWANDYKIPVPTNDLDASKAKTIYGIGLDAGSEFTSTKQSSQDANYQKNIQDDWWTRSKKYDSGFYVIQIKQDDFESQEKLKSFLDTNLSWMSFSKILFALSQDADIIKQANDDFSNTITKITPFDSKIQKILNPEWLSTK